VKDMGNGRRCWHGYPDFIFNNLLYYLGDGDYYRERCPVKNRTGVQRHPKTSPTNNTKKNFPHIFFRIHKNVIFIFMKKKKISYKAENNCSHDILFLPASF
jgi:hypothetical protein